MAAARTAILIRTTSIPATVNRTRSCNAASPIARARISPPPDWTTSSWEPRPACGIRRITTPPPPPPPLRPQGEGITISSSTTSSSNKTMVSWRRSSSSTLRGIDYLSHSESAIDGKSFPGDAVTHHKYFAIYFMLMTNHNDFSRLA